MPMPAPMTIQLSSSTKTTHLRSSKSNAVHIAPTEEYIPKAFTAFEKRWKINEILNQDHTSLLDSYDK